VDTPYKCETVNGEVILRSKGDEVDGNEDVEVVFRAYICGKWIKHQTNTKNTKMNFDPFYAYRRLTLTLTLTLSFITHLRLLAE